MSEKYNLKWNDFQGTVSKSFSKLRSESHLQDVTLFTSDQHHIPAHRLVLSACSQYFSKLLREVSQPQPLICLDSIDSKQLGNVLDYVYQGEVKLDQNELETFLKTAQTLKLSGLQENKEIAKDAAQDLKSDANPSHKHLIANDAENKSDSDYTLAPTEIETTLKSEPVPIQIMSSDLSQVEQTLLDNMERNPDKTYSCKLCGKVASKANARQNMMNHIETHIDGLTYSCKVEDCQKSFSTRHSMRNHKSKYHKQFNMSIH